MPEPNIQAVSYELTPERKARIHAAGEAIAKAFDTIPNLSAVEAYLAAAAFAAALAAHTGIMGVVPPGSVPAEGQDDKSVTDALKAAANVKVGSA